MKITIDTNDGPGELRKAIRLLQGYLGENVQADGGASYGTSGASSDSSGASGGLFNLFSDNPSSASGSTSGSVSEQAEPGSQEAKDEPAPRVTIVEY